MSGVDNLEPINELNSIKLELKKYFNDKQIELIINLYKFIFFIISSFELKE